MLIKYEFADGTISEVEVSDEIGNEILNSRREEENLARKERSHCYSVEAAVYEGADYAGETLEESLYGADGNLAKRVERAFSHLTPIQRNRLELLAGGFSEREIAELEGKNFSTVHESIAGARKKFKKYF